MVCNGSTFWSEKLPSCCGIGWPQPGCFCGLGFQADQPPALHESEFSTTLATFWNSSLYVAYLAWHPCHSTDGRCEHFSFPPAHGIPYGRVYGAFQFCGLLFLCGCCVFPWWYVSLQHIHLSHKYVNAEDEHLHQLHNS